MAKKGLIFRQNKKPLGNESFLYKQIYSFIPEFDTFCIVNGNKQKRTVKTFIELEVYQYKICVISFFNEGFGKGKDKYRVRCKLGPGHIKAIIKGCLEAYYRLIDKKGHHAFIFSAANDINDVQEDNKRNSIYTLYIDYNFRNREDYIQDGSLRLNTFKLVHKGYEFNRYCDRFFADFEKRVEEEINSPGEDCK